MSNDLQIKSKSRYFRIALILGLSILGIAIALLVQFSNGDKSGAIKIANQCPLNEQGAKAISSLKEGDLGALIGTGLGRGYANMKFLQEDRQELSIADFSGKPILVNFWATWCAPCREEMPAIDDLAAKYDKDVFEVVTINLDRGEKGLQKARKFFDEIEIENLKLYADPTYKAFDLLVTNSVALGLPATLLLDKSGCELAILQGPATWDSEVAINVIDELIIVSSK